MADEQIIYLSPEEELTSVRERLERIPTRRIILVVPTQTQLRSHVSWRLLHARARELNKEVLIISSDRQIRSVVKAAGFKVAESMESPPSSRPRPVSRPGRSSLGGKTSARLRTPPARSLPTQQAAPPRVQQPYEQPAQQYFNQAGMQQEVDEKQSSLGGGRDDVDMEDKGQAPLESPSPASATFGMDDKQFGPGFDYRVGSSAPPPIRPVVPPYSSSTEDEEPNQQQLEDYQQSQSIRHAARQNDADTMLPPPDNVQSSQARPQMASEEARSQIFDLPPREADGPFTYLEDAQSVPLPEQRASVSMDEVADKVPDIADYPTTPIDDIHHIEDQGDLGEINDLSASPSPSWTMPAPDEEQDIQGPSRVHGVRPRTNRTGKVLPPLPRESLPDSDDMELPPVYDQETPLSPPPATAHPSGALSGEQLRQPGAGNRPVRRGGGGADVGSRSHALPQPQADILPRPGQPRLKKRPTSNRPASGAPPRSRRQPTAPLSQQAKKKASSGRIVVPLLIVLTVLIIVLLAFLGPSADVTIMLPSQNYTVQTKLTATATSRQDVVRQTLPAQTLTFDTSVTGPGHATGTTTVGTRSATGNIVFTNTGTTSIVIPTDTTVSTKSGVQFTTTAEALALPPNPSPNPVPVPIQAQNPGANGNLPANAITKIPSDGQTKILQANPGLTTLALSVNNTDPTTGGGAGNATSVSSNDVNSEKAVLDGQVQAQVKNFLQKNVHAGDQQGTPIQTETPVATPAVNNVATDGTFKETLKLHMTVLVVRAADLQAAAIAQLKETVAKQMPGFTLVPQQPVELKQLKNAPAKDGQTLSLSFTAVGQVARQISEDAIRNLVSGKSIDAAKHALVGTNGIPGVQDSQIAVYPGFFHWMPFWSQRINVHFKTIPVKPVPIPKPKTK
jgi:hypothetical protein